MKGSLKFWIIVFWIGNVLSLYNLFTCWWLDSVTLEVLGFFTIIWYGISFILSMGFWMECEGYFEYCKRLPHGFLIKATSVLGILIAGVVYAIRHFNTFLDRVFHPNRWFSSPRKSFKRPDINHIRRLMDELEESEVGSTQEKRILVELERVHNGH